MAFPYEVDTFANARNGMVAENVETRTCNLIQGTYFTYSLDCLYLIGEVSDLRTFRKTDDNHVPTTYPPFNLKWFTQCETARVMSNDYIEIHSLPGEKVKKKKCVFKEKTFQPDHLCLLHILCNFLYLFFLRVRTFKLYSLSKFPLHDSMLSFY